MAVRYMQVIGTAGFVQDLTPGLGWNQFVLPIPNEDTGGACTRVIPGLTVDEISGSWSQILARNPTNASPWPTGDYAATLRAVQCPAGVSYKIQLLHVSATGVVKDVLGTSGSFNDTAEHTYTVNATPTAVAVNDRFQVRILGTNANAGNATLIFGDNGVGYTCGYASGPWAVPPAQIVTPNNNGEEVVGPFKIGALFYMIFVYGHNVLAYVATDPHPGVKSDWTVQDTQQVVMAGVLGGTVASGDVQQFGMRAVLIGSTLHLVWQIVANAGTGSTLYYTTFDGTTLATPEIIAGGPGTALSLAPPGQVNLTLEVRPTDGHALVAYAVGVGFPAVYTTYYQERTAPGVWAARVQVNTTVNCQLVGTVISPTGRLHVHYWNHLSSNYYHRSLSAADALDTEQLFVPAASVPSTDPCQSCSSNMLLSAGTVTLDIGSQLYTYPDTANPVAAAGPIVAQYDYPQLAVIAGVQYIFSGSGGFIYFITAPTWTNITFTGAPGAAVWTALSLALGYFAGGIQHHGPKIAFAMLPDGDIGPLYWELVLPGGAPPRFWLGHPAHPANSGTLIRGAPRQYVTR